MTVKEFYQVYWQHPAKRLMKWPDSCRLNISYAVSTSLLVPLLLAWLVALSIPGLFIGLGEGVRWLFQGREPVVEEHPVRCKDCQFVDEAFLTAYDGQGVYRFAYCKFDLVNPVVVDPGAERYCRDYNEQERQGSRPET